MPDVRRVVGRTPVATVDHHHRAQTLVARRPADPHVLRRRRAVYLTNPWRRGRGQDPVLGHSAQVLVDAEDVALWIAEPGRLLGAEHAHVSDRLEPGEVVVVEDHAAGLELLDRRADVAHAE